MKPEKSLIQIRDLYKVFKMGENEVIALNKINVDIPKGSFTVIMGPSGSGKSTLLYLLGGLDWPTSGSLLVDGDEVAKMDENTLADYRQKKVGFIFQSFNLISSMPAEENIAFPLRFAGISKAQRLERSTELLEKVGLTDRIGHKPTELSGGQQQRVAVARALVNDPPLILADEPTGNLDSSSGFAIMELLSELQKGGKTVVVVTHDQRMTQFATNTIFLLDGNVVTEAEFLKATQLQRK
ncbi:MAG: ABC transporter ATP-binding protein [Anaerolineaceae bacterium]|nr:ABC transporter ATP-binding protein [Anaerolineaceae bacterium]